VRRSNEKLKRIVAAQNGDTHIPWPIAAQISRDREGCARWHQATGTEPTVSRHKEVSAGTIVMVAGIVFGLLLTYAVEEIVNLWPAREGIMSMNTADAWIICTGMVCLTVLIIFLRIYRPDTKR
jgi:hypothetical protein